MSKGAHHIEDLIARYLTGEATPEEIAIVDKWRNETESNGRYFKQLKLIFERAATIPATESFDVDRGWSMVRSKLQEKRYEATISIASRNRTFLRIAAGITIFLAFGILTYNFFRADSVQRLNLVADETVKSDTLPDGSRVFLNRHTRIDYYFDRRSEAHTVKLSGEAYFDINHVESEIFIVQADETFIKDVGTSFNVKAYPGSAVVEVMVAEGEVMFYTDGSSGIHLKANDKGVFDKKKRTFTVEKADPNAAAYKTRFFSFSNHSLEEIVKSLNEVYSTKIAIGENLKDCRLTVSFNDESIDEIAGVIAETLGLTVSTSGNVINLKGTGCAKTQP